MTRKLHGSRGVKSAIFALFLLFSSGFATQLLAQQYKFENGTTGSNSIPWGGGSWANQRNQWFYAPGDFGSKVPGGKAIKTIYVKTGTINNATTFTNFSISLGQPSITGLSTAWVTGLTQVMATSSYSMPATSTDTWIAIDLDKPFAFNPKLPLVVETIQTATTGGKALRAGGTPIDTKYSGNTQTYGASSAGSGSSRRYSYAMGLDLVSLGPNNGGVAAIDSPDVFCAGTKNIYATIGNYGTNQITTLTVNWKLDGVGQTPITYTSTLDTAGGKGPTEVMIKLGSASFTKARTIKVWTSNPNNVTDTVNDNDTIYKTVAPALPGGIYYIGPKGQYKSIAAAADDLNNYGICGAVEFRVTPGTYTGNVVINEIKGASSTNTIKFISASTDSVTITNSGSSYTNWITVLLNGADYVSFENFKIRATGTSYAVGVFFTAGADYNMIKNCIVDAGTSTTSSLTAPIIFSGSTGSISTYGNNGNYNIIEGNQLLGGYYGMRMVGSSSSSYIEGNQILNNTFENQYYYGMYTYYTSGTVFKDNKIDNIRIGTSSYGLYCYYNSNFDIERNFIRGGNNYFGYANYYLYNSKVKSIFANNMVMGTGSSYTLYAYYMRYTNFYHNSLSGVGSYLVYWYYGADNDVRNNIFEWGGTTYMLYFYNNTFTAFDYNDFYLPKGGTLAYNTGSTISSLSGLKSAFTGMNLHSWELNPEFVASTADLHVTSKFPGMYGANVGLVRDMDGDARCVFSPAIGADEFSTSSTPPTASFLVPDTAWINSTTSFLNGNKPGGPVKNRWYVDGKLVSDSIHLDYIFNTVGTHDVSLAMENCGGTDSIQKTVLVSATLRKPVADFSAQSRNLYTGSTIWLKDISENGASTWSWTISPVWTFVPFLSVGARTFVYVNGTDSTQSRPQIRFDYPGRFEVCLKVSNSKGADSLCRTAYINVRENFTMCQIPEETTSSAGTLYDDGGPSGNYTAGKNGSNICWNRITTCVGELELSLREFDLQSGDYLRIYDGVTNSGKPLWNKSLSASGFTGGLADVPKTLIAKSGSAYFEFESDANTATTGAGFAIDWIADPTTFTPPVALFDTPDTACTGMPVYYQHKSAGMFSEIEWYVDGVLSGFGETFTYTFKTKGSYNIMLKALSDCAGRDSITWAQIVEDASKAPKPALYIDKTIVQVGDTVTISDMSEYCSSGTRWELSPASYILVDNVKMTDKDIKVVFTKKGYYDVKQVKTNSFGSDSTTWTNAIQVLQYCEPYTINLSADVAISRVAFNDFDHKSSVGVYGYRNFTGQVSTTVERGLTYGITVERATNATAMSRKVWIDYNADGDFDDAGELVMSELNSTSLSHTDSIRIPFTATAGMTRMRVGVSYKNQSNTACGPNQTGEFEDYRVIISDKDLTAPYLMLRGAMVDTIEVYSNWVNPGAYAYDKFDGLLTSKVIVSSNLDTAILGEYQVNYVVADATGNTVGATRTVYVVDRTLPQITLNGNDTVYVEINTPYTEMGVVVTDNYDNGLVEQVSSSVDTTTLGTYNISYCVTDVSNNGPVCISRTVIVGDTTDPMITLLGADKVTIEVYESYTDAMYTVSDNNPKGLTVNTSGTWTGKPDMLGVFEVTYTAMDQAGNTAAVTREITVVDTKAPVLKLRGNRTDTVYRWSVYEDALYSVTDNYADSASLTYTVEGNFVNTLSNGVYYLSYKATDPSGNASEILTRIIVVVTDPNANSIDENNTSDLTIFPNPSTGQFMISTSTLGDKTAEIRVFNSAGQQVYLNSNVRFDQGQVGLDLSTLSEGTYFLRISSESTSEIKQIIILK